VPDAGRGLITAARQRVERARFTGIGAPDERNLCTMCRRQRVRVGDGGDELDIAENGHCCDNQSSLSMGISIEYGVFLRLQRYYRALRKFRNIE